MNKKAPAGGRSTRKRKGSGIARAIDADPIDPDAVDFDRLDWTRVESLELDPVLIEQIRARRALRSITLRVGVEQIAEARRVAERTGLPYQAVLRRWLAEGASIARSKRSRTRSGRRAAR
jgi:predicted DNA binding CopG/RHH family protein